MEFRRSGASEKQILWLPSKSEYVVLFFSKVGHSELVLLQVTWND